MTPAEHLKRLSTPAADRWRPMLLGLALAAACAGAAVLARESAALSLLLTLAALGAWLAGACALAGYLRWFYAESLAQAARDRAAANRRREHPGISRDR